MFFFSHRLLKLLLCGGSAGEKSFLPAPLGKRPVKSGLSPPHAWAAWPESGPSRADWLWYSLFLTPLSTSIRQEIRKDDRVRHYRAEISVLETCRPIPVNSCSILACRA